jgi:hypothetical protein
MDSKRRAINEGLRSTQSHVDGANASLTSAMRKATETRDAGGPDFTGRIQSIYDQLTALSESIEAGQGPITVPNTGGSDDMD